MGSSQSRQAAEATAAAQKITIALWLTTLTHEIQETHSSLDGFRGFKLGRFAGSEKNEPDWRLFCGHGRAPTPEHLPHLLDAKADG